MRRGLAILLAAVAALAAGCGLRSGGGRRHDVAAAPPCPPGRRRRRSRSPTARSRRPIPGSRRCGSSSVGAADPVRLRFHDQPRSGLLFDLDTGEVLWRRLPDRVLPIASLTKMMTALIVVQRERPADKVKVTKEALAYKGSGVGVLPRGKRIKLETMLNGLLLPSGNDAAIALAQRVSGTVQGFVTRMNEQRAGARPVVHALHVAERLRRRRATTRARPTSPRSPARSSTSPASRGSSSAAGRSSRSRSRAGGSTSSTTTRCCAPATRGRSGSRRASRTPPAAASWRPHSAAARRLGVVLLHSPDPGRQARVLLDRGFKVGR